MTTESISSLFIIAAVLIASIVAYNVVVPFLTEWNATVLTVEAAEAQANAAGAVVAINVRNAAVKQMHLVELNVQVEGCDIARFNVDVPPGGSYPLIMRNPLGKWMSGELKNAVVTAFFSDGSTASVVAPIRVYGGGWVGSEEDPLEDHEEGGNQTGGGGQTGKTTVFADDFKNGLSGWQPWGTASSLIVEVDMHGKPSPSLHVHAGGTVGTLAGASKTVNLTVPATMLFTFNYKVHAMKDGGAFPGNLWVRVLGPSGNVLVDEKIYEAKSTDSGWKDAAAEIPPVTGRITLVVYTQILSSNGEDFWVDNAVLDP